MTEAEQTAWVLRLSERVKELERVLNIVMNVRMDDGATIADHCGVIPDFPLDSTNWPAGTAKPLPYQVVKHP